MTVCERRLTGHREGMGGMLRSQGRGKDDNAGEQGVRPTPCASAAARCAALPDLSLPPGAEARRTAERSTSLMRSMASRPPVAGDGQVAPGPYRLPPQAARWLRATAARCCLRRRLRASGRLSRTRSARRSARRAPHRQAVGLPCERAEPQRRPGRHGRRSSPTVARLSG